MIYLVAGHRGENSGARGFIDEGAETVALRDSLAEELRRRGVAVVSDDDAAGLGGVVADVNSRTAAGDWVLDLHFNAFNGRAHGTEVLVSANAGSTVRTAAGILLAAVCDALGTRPRGVKLSGEGQHRRLAILDDTRCRALLLEVCFCDNGGDAELYRKNRERLVCNIAYVLYSINGNTL